MSEPEKLNAKITGTMLGVEDHGCFTAMVYTQHEQGNQGFGGYVLGEGSCVLFLKRLLDVVGVDQWEHLAGKPCRVVADYGKIYKIGNYLEDKWFDPKAEFEAMQNEKSESIEEEK